MAVEVNRPMKTTDLVGLPVTRNLSFLQFWAHQVSNRASPNIVKSAWLRHTGLYLAASNASPHTL